MIFAEYWSILRRKNPGLADESKSLNIKAGELKRILEQAWETGRSHAEEIHKAVETIFRKMGRG